MSQSIPPITHAETSKIWIHFTRCDGDSNKVGCNLCSAEILYKGSTNILWNHIRFKHSIGKKSTSNEEDNCESSKTNMTPTKLHGDTKNPHQNTDLLGYGPSPTSTRKISSNSISSISKNFLTSNIISRLNQISLPSARKLKFWNKKSFQVNQYDPTFRVIYLGNLGVQFWSKDETGLDKPLSTLWNHHLMNMKKETEITMRLTICNSGLKALTHLHGLTQYWSNRLVYCCSHQKYPKIFSWIYRYEGKKMRQELRCHAVLCPTPEKAAKMVTLLNHRLACALQEFRREKKTRGPNTIDSKSTTQHQLPRIIPLRRQILEKGSANFRPPLEKSKSASRLHSILEEDYEMTTQHEDYNNEFSDDDYDEEQSHKDDEGTTHNMESDTSSSTVNEETSTDTVCVDGSFGTHGQLNTPPEIGDKSHIVRVTKSLSNSSSTLYSSDKSHNPLTKESITIGDVFDDIDNHKQDIRNSSANTKIESSLTNIAVSHEKSDDEGTSSLIFQRSKNIDRSHMNENQQQENRAEELSNRDIVLSWSNLVIK